MHLISTALKLNENSLFIFVLNQKYSYNYSISSLLMKISTLVVCVYKIVIIAQFLQ